MVNQMVEDRAFESLKDKREVVKKMVTMSRYGKPVSMAPAHRYFSPLTTYVENLRELFGNDYGISEEAITAVVLTEKDTARGLPLFHLGINLIEKDESKEASVPGMQLYMKANTDICQMGVDAKGKFVRRQGTTELYGSTSWKHRRTDNVNKWQNYGNEETTAGSWSGAQSSAGAAASQGWVAPEQWKQSSNTEKWS